MPAVPMNIPPQNTVISPPLFWRMLLSKRSVLAYVEACLADPSVTCSAASAGGNVWSLCASYPVGKRACSQLASLQA